jgi:hypothetical protein
MQAANQRCLEDYKVQELVREEASRSFQQQIPLRMITIKFIKSD